MIWEQTSTEGRMWVRKQGNCKYSKKQAVPVGNPYAASDITAATVEGLCKHVLHCPSLEKISPAWVQERCRLVKGRACDFLVSSSSLVRDSFYI